MAEFAKDAGTNGGRRILRRIGVCKEGGMLRENYCEQVKTD